MEPSSGPGQVPELDLWEKRSKNEGGEFMDVLKDKDLAISIMSNFKPSKYFVFATNRA